MAVVVASRNLFIDSSNNITGEGDNFVLELSGHTISAGDGQILRLTLVNFNMYNNIYQVNDSNNHIKCAFTANAQTGNFEFRLPARNYATLPLISQAFYEAFRDELVTNLRVATGTANLTAAISGIKAGEDPGPLNETRILSFKLTFSAAHQLTALTVILNEDVSDSFILLGGDRSHAAAQAQGFNVTISSTTEITIEGLYPMQGSTSPELFLRVDTPSTNVEMTSLTGVNRSSDQITSSNILGKFQFQDDFIHYDSNSDEFFMDLQQKQLNHLRFSLTDRKNRRLQHAGPGTAQNTKGNLFFSAVVRIDVVQRTHPKYLEVKPQPLPNLKNSTFNLLPPA